MNAGPLIFLAAMIALLWFVLIRPQRRRQQEHRNLIAEIAPNDEVVTAGGMFGKVRSIADDHVLLEIAPGTEVRIAKQAVTGVVQKDQEASAEPESRG
jgi:preprotein translocase subunit YajC